MRSRPVALTLSATLLFTAGCGTSSQSGAASGSVAQATGTPAPASPSPSPSATASTALGKTLAAAVVQIEARGTFRWPFAGREEETGRGSGFIVDPSGIIVTNNHVVTGADSVTVWVGPDRSEHDATVLGASECSDLAVVRIGGGPHPALDWYEGEIQPGLPIFAAGFPLGDPEFTMTGGIVSRAHGYIDESWASVDNSIEHDATINPGSSGGPVVTAGGQVVAVNYAGDDSTRQSFAISREEALPILQALRRGERVTSIGINGTAIGPNDYGLPEGIWVSSVAADSPAGKAGILPGDSVTELDGKPTTDGTMTAYCDVLRGSGEEDTVPFTVFREDSREALVGELNGTALDPGFAFADELGEGTPEDLTALGFVEADTATSLAFEVPEAWDDTLDQPWMMVGREVGDGVVVSSDVGAFKDGWRTPGVFVATAGALGQVLDVDDVLDGERSRFENTCEYASRDSFSRGGYVGRYDLWEGCGGTESRFLTLAAEPEDEQDGEGRMLYLQFQAASDEDLAVLDRVLATLEVDAGD
jgi:serine protease Do